MASPDDIEPLMGRLELQSLTWGKLGVVDHRTRCKFAHGRDQDPVAMGLDKPEQVVVVMAPVNALRCGAIKVVM